MCCVSLGTHTLPHRRGGSWAAPSTVQANRVGKTGGDKCAPREWGKQMSEHPPAPQPSEVNFLIELKTLHQKAALNEGTGARKKKLEKKLEKGTSWLQVCKTHKGWEGKF